MGLPRLVARKWGKMYNSTSLNDGYLNLGVRLASNTPIIDKIDKLERQILDGKLMFMDDDGNSVIPMGDGDCDSDSESEVEVVFDEIANLMVSTSFKGGSDKGYDTIACLNNGGK
uniref:Uncharacterized protein n=1 Tax=Tanacetum cinerariifolium TaxID=118510 RepID=A0A6L2JHU5_TANCI|nr:hypothetical protein [Tanacetum cinerariifolium]